MDEEAILLEEMVALQVDPPPEGQLTISVPTSATDVDMLATEEPKPALPSTSREVGGPPSVPAAADVAEMVTVPLAWLRQLVAAARSAGVGPEKTAPAPDKKSGERDRMPPKRAKEAPQVQRQACCCRCPCRREASPVPGPSGARRRGQKSPQNTTGVPKSRRGRREGRVCRREAIREVKPPKKKPAAPAGDGRKCWRCGLAGHPYSQCPLPPSPEDRFCYRCGKQGVTVADCPRRHKGSGAGHPRPDKPQ